MPSSVTRKAILLKCLEVSQSEIYYLNFPELVLLLREESIIRVMKSNFVIYSL
jgi:hypothetical protein